MAKIVLKILVLASAVLQNENTSSPSDAQFRVYQRAYVLLKLADIRVGVYEGNLYRNLKKICYFLNSMTERTE